MAEALSRIQLEFAALLRDPELAAPAGTDARRLALYRRLFYRNIERCLAQTFPRLRKLHDTTAWHVRVRDFYARHPCADPRFHRLPAAFVDYLHAPDSQRDGDPPQLRELAQHEWLELALATDPRDPDDIDADRNGDLLEAPPLLSPLVRRCRYRYPVHRDDRDDRLVAPTATPSRVIACRGRDDRVRFHEINPLTDRLIALIETSPRSNGRDLLLRLARERAQPDPERLLAEGAALLAQLRARDIVLGTRTDRSS